MEKDMAQFFITYLGGDEPSSPQAGRENFARYQAWLLALGESAVSPMNPLKDTHTVRGDGSVENESSTAMSGFTIVEAESMYAALDIAKACPFLEIGGSLEVSELIQM